MCASYKASCGNFWSANEERPSVDRYLLTRSYLPCAALTQNLGNFYGPQFLVHLELAELIEVITNQILDRLSLLTFQVAPYYKLRVLKRILVQQRQKIYKSFDIDPCSL